MDGPRFDDLTRALATVRTRRGLLGTLVGGLLAATGLGEAAALGCRKVTRTCNRDAQCCSGLCGPPDFTGLRSCRCVTAEDCPVRCDLGPACAGLSTCDSGNCRRAGCLIDDVIYGSGDRNEANRCQFCDPNLNWREWSDHDDGVVCGDPLADPCISDFSTCLAGDCVPLPLPDGHECGEGQVCCLGSCCDAGVPCNSVSGCGGCEIDGAPVVAGTPNPANACELCDALANPGAWTIALGSPPCGDDGDRVCCNGACCPPGQCCGPTGLCEACGEPECTVNGAWCGSGNNQACCDGECCAYGQYCGSPGGGGGCACCPTGEHCNGGACEPW